jgi:hypothetical protein
LAQSLLQENLVPPHALSLQQIPQPKFCYSNALRCIGQSLESLDLKSLEVKTHGDTYVIQAWNKGTSTSMDIERHCGPDDLKKLEMEGRQKRKAIAGTPNLLSLSQVLRLAGNYVDRMQGRLIRVSWQDQSDKIQSITIQYESTQTRQGESQTTVIEELCIHVYKTRKKIAGTQDKNSHRPFVSVNNAS